MFSSTHTQSDAGNDLIRRDRDRLVAACIDAYDRIESASVRGDLICALADAGVTVIEIPAQTRFDPRLHKASDTRITDRDELNGLVFETERPGFVDRDGSRLRWPEVVVYQTGPARSEASAAATTEVG